MKNYSTNNSSKQHKRRISLGFCWNQKKKRNFLLKKWQITALRWCFKGPECSRCFTNAKEEKFLKEWSAKCRIGFLVVWAKYISFYNVIGEKRAISRWENKKEAQNGPWNSEVCYKQKENALHNVKCAPWVQRHAGGCTRQKWNQAKNAGSKNRDHHKSDDRDLGAALCCWLYWTKMNPSSKVETKNSDFMQVLRFCLIGQPSLNKNETALFDIIFIA